MEGRQDQKKDDILRRNKSSLHMRVCVIIQWCSVTQ